MNKYRVTMHEIIGSNHPYSSPYHAYKEIEAETYKTDPRDNSLIFQAESKTVAIFSAGSWQTIELIPEPKPSPVLTEEVFLKHFNRDSRLAAAESPMRGPSIEEQVRALVKPRSLVRRG